MSWTPFPILRIAILFIAGILISDYFKVQVALESCVLVSAAGCVLYFLCIKTDKLIRGLVASFLIILFGILIVPLRTSSNSSDHIIHFSSISAYDVTLDSYPEEKESVWKIVGAVDRVHEGDTVWPVTGKVMLYLSKDSFQESLKYGDVLHVFGHPVEIQPPANPGEFDYKQFLAYKNIFHQHYVAAVDSVILLDHAPKSFLIEYSGLIRDWAQRQISAFIEGRKEKAIASALVLGVKDGLDNELLNAYSTSGAMHVLAVSGLHVGIVFVILTSLLKPFTSSAKGKWFVAICLIAFLWMYAMVTGLSPSVVRSVTMFTFVALAKPLNRTTNIFNLLAIAALLMLCYDPFLIMSVGFQLSFLAVCGIVYFHPRLYAVWSPDSKLLDRVWQLSSVSISAQIATFPLGLLYFHQFPVYFLLSNLFVIPAAFVVLVGGLLLLAISWLHPVVHVIGYCLNYFIRALNYLISQVENLPASSIKGVLLTGFQVLLLYVLIGLVTGLIQKRKFHWVASAFVVVIIFSATQWWYYFNTFKKPVLTCFDVGRNTAVEFCQRGETLLVADSALLKDSASVNFHIIPNRVLRGVAINKEMILIDSTNQASLFVINNKRILILNAEYACEEPLNVDYLVIANNALENYIVPKCIKARMIVLASSNSYYFAEQVKKLAVENDQRVYSVGESGAFQTEL